VPPTNNWNEALEQASRVPHEKRFGGFFAANTAAAVTEETNATNHEETNNNTNNSSGGPVGIIDLECYTNIHETNHSLLELTGDKDDPELRAFYFCVPPDTSVDEWRNALLQDRHGQLRDEVEAYKQVCDGFSEQLQGLHQEVDESLRAREDSDKELYAVRSQSEDGRRKLMRLVEDVLESSSTNDDDDEMKASKERLRQGLEHVRAQGMDTTASGQLLTDYCLDMQQIVHDLRRETAQLRNELQQTGRSDQAKVQQLQDELEELHKSRAYEREQWEQKEATLQAALETNQQELDTVQKALSATKMEMTMHGSSQKNAVKELQQHKKILKREVLELRSARDSLQQRVDQQEKELQQTTLKHKESEQKSVLLERYMEKMESQVQVQQNMMELMSQSASVRGGSVMGSVVSYTQRRRNTTPRNDDDDDFEDNTDDEHLLSPPPEVLRKKANTRTRYTFDDDNKSHMSELTEDRTQRHLETIHKQFQKRHSPRKKKTPKTPERSTETTRHLDTITQSANSTPHRSTGSGQSLSTAQRARLEADRRSGTPVKVHLPPNPPPSPGSGLWRRVESAVLGPESSSDDDEEESISADDSIISEEKKSEVDALSLQEREMRQKLKQMEFLRQQGLLDDSASISMTSSVKLGG